MNSTILQKYSKVLNLIPFYFASRTMCSKTVNIQLDAIDSFTSKLLQTKSNKWEDYKQKIEAKSTSQTLAVDLRKFNINNFSRCLINSVLMQLVEESDMKKLNYVIEECVRNNVSPKYEVVLSVLDACVRNGETNLVLLVKNLMENNNFKVYVDNGKFDHYLAEVIWINGDIPKALALFEEVYTNNLHLHRRLKTTLKNLIFDMPTRSEALLITLIQFCERLITNFNDFHPMVCVWQVCFTSEWFSDQKIAMDLLDKHNGLCKAIQKNLPYVVSTSLRQHKTDVVYRLLEILLKYEMKDQYSGVLLSLFDYSLHQGDSRTCLEIIHWSKENNVTLPNCIHEQMVMLLLTDAPSSVNKKKKYSKKPPTIKMKF